MTVKTRCIACGKCAEVCPSKDNTCTVCGACVAICPTGARSISGYDVSAADLMAVITRDTVFYEESGGGVTFSGGEPLSQPEFLLECLSLCREAGIHTAVDTSGYNDSIVFLEIVKNTDLLLYDIKTVDNEIHKRFTGVDATLILENLKRASSAECPIEIRIPVIPEVNDTIESCIAITAVLRTVKRISGIRLLPYHTTGVQKHMRLFGSYAMEALVPPSSETMKKLAEVFIRAGFATHIGG